MGYMPWGLNWLAHHPTWDRDFGHFGAMQYKSVVVYRPMWESREWMEELARRLPDAIFLARDWEMSEQKQDMYSNPAETGKRHAREWVEKVNAGRVHLPLDRTYFLGINEPDSNHAQAAIDTYNLAFCLNMAAYGLTVAGYSFGVGHPSTVGLRSDTPVDWSLYRASAEAIIENGGIVDFHSYGVPPGWSLDHHLARVADCPYPFQVVFGEFGVDWGIVPGMKVDGWAKPSETPDHNLTGEQYLKWADTAQQLILERFAERKSKLTVHSFNFFCYDANRDWRSFDVEPLRGLLETWPAWTEPKKPEHSVNLPIVISGADVIDPDLWEKCVEIIIDKFEGGLSLDPNDSGNWYNGKLVGTKYGISAAVWGGQYDIPNLTRKEAESIYFVHYWKASGADQLQWPACLVVFDTAVQHGVWKARELWQKSGGRLGMYLDLRRKYYQSLKSFPIYGTAWMNRLWELVSYLP